jgi:hypothetical protein
MTARFSSSAGTRPCASSRRRARLCGLRSSSKRASGGEQLVVPRSRFRSASVSTPERPSRSRTAFAEERRIPAARLCSLAAPGEILASETVLSLARTVAGIRFVNGRPVRLKGIEKAVRIVEVVPEAGLPPLPELPKAMRFRFTRRGLPSPGSWGSPFWPASSGFS